MSTKTLVIMALLGGGAYLLYANNKKSEENNIIMPHSSTVTTSPTTVPAIIDHVPILNAEDIETRARFLPVSDSYVPINKFNLTR